MEASPPNSNQMATSSRPTRKPSSYPPPFIIPPRASHKQTLILLHGRGGNGESFGSAILTRPLSKPNNTTIRSTFPHMKFIFPTTAPRRARWYNRAVINQWFDNVPIDEQDTHDVSREQEGWQLEGLRETAEFLNGIVEEEARLVGEGNVFVGGLSQGCAASLHFLLSYKGQGTGEPLGGFVGMSGWLPFARDVEGILKPQGDHEVEDDDDPFATPASDSDASPAVQVCNFIRDNMDLPPIEDSHQPLCLTTPVFLGHGTQDEKVKVGKGRQVARILRDMGVADVTWKEYDEGHWYKVPDELDDIVECLRRWMASK